MICEEVVVDLRMPDPKNFEEGKRLAQGAGARSSRRIMQVRCLRN